MANEKIPAWKLRQQQLRQGGTPRRTTKRNDELGSTRLSFESRRRRLDMEEDSNKPSSSSSLDSKSSNKPSSSSSSLDSKSSNKPPSSSSLDNKNRYNKPSARIPAWKLREQQKPSSGRSLSTGRTNGTLSTRSMTTTPRYRNSSSSNRSSNMSVGSNSTLSSNASSHVSRYAFKRRGPLDPSLPPAFRAAALRRDPSFPGVPHDDGLSTLGGSVTSNDKSFGLCGDDSDDDDDSDLSDCDSFASLDSDADDEDEAYSASRNQMARSLVADRPQRRSKHKSRFHSDSKGVHGIPLFIIAECSEHGGR